MFLLSLVSFFAAVLSGMGVGSAGLLVVFLTFAQGLPQHTAQGVNLIFFVLCAGAALAVHVKRTPPFWGLVLLLVPTGLLGAWVGASVARDLPRALLRRLFGWFLLCSSLLGLFQKKDE